MIYKTVVIFGVFDGVHEGHHEFIKQARAQGEKLVAIVARDNIVERIKNSRPYNDELERLNEVLNVKEVDMAYLGDREQGVYNILKEINPDMVYLGYDQQDLYNDILQKIKTGYLPSIELIFGKPHRPDLFHSSILNNPSSL